MAPSRYRRTWITLLALAAVAAGGMTAAFAADDAPATWRRYDAKGSFAGTARQVDGSRVRFYDAKGRFAGTAYRQRNGSWRTYDGKGAFKGTARKAE